MEEKERREVANTVMARLIEACAAAGPLPRQSALKVIEAAIKVVSPEGCNPCTNHVASLADHQEGQSQSHQVSGQQGGHDALALACGCAAEALNGDPSVRSRVIVRRIAGRVAWSASCTCGPGTMWRPSMQWARRAGACPPRTVREDHMI
jgi:hypothetical protein